MPRDPNQEPPYAIGYRKPPHHTRFKPGCSGNPRGRPKDAKNLSTLVHEALNEQVVVAENGRRRKVSKRQAIIKQLINRSAQGDLKAMQMLLAIMQDIEHRSEAEPTETTFGAADEKVIEQLKVWLLAIDSGSL
jgi:Family of unknown function (DUF5681)